MSFYLLAFLSLLNKRFFLHHCLYLFQVTSGGTESILLACLAYRNRAMERGVRFPEM